MKSVLFVCLGNICRSPTAEGVFRHLADLADLGDELEIDSAGTAAWHAGNPPDPRTVEAAAGRGYDLSPLRARKVVVADFDRFDLVLAMDRENLENLRALCPAGREDRLRLFLEFADDPAEEVPDPYYEGARGFQRVLDLVEDASRGLIAHIRELRGELGVSRDTCGLVTAALGTEAVDARPLSGGCVGEVYRLRLGDGREVVAKVDGAASAALSIEGRMLSYLSETSDLPVPAVLHAADDLLVMEYIPGSGGLTSAGERHAAALLAALHEVRGDRFGLDFDTLIGGLPQANPWRDSWVEFFAEARIGHMARLARDAGRLPAATQARLEALSARLGELIDEPLHPSLLHGDVWSGNVLGDGDRVAGFVDPAVYYGHPEVELAFTTMFSTFGESFYQAYDGLRGIADGFFETRREVYNLYPLLVHVRLFGGGYLSGIERTLSRFGF